MRPSLLAVLLCLLFCLCRPLSVFLPAHESVLLAFKLRPPIPVIVMKTDRNGSREAGGAPRQQYNYPHSYNTHKHSKHSKYSKTDRMATQWIVSELWDLHGHEIEHAFATKSGAENWVRIACAGEKQPENIYIEERPIVKDNKECYHCKATADLVWSEGYGGIHICGFCKVIEDNACGECEKQSDGTFKTGEDGFLRCSECA